MPPIPLLIALAVALLIKENKKATAASNARQQQQQQQQQQQSADPEVERLRRQNARLKRKLANKPGATSASATGDTSNNQSTGDTQ